MDRGQEGSSQLSFTVGRAGTCIPNTFPLMSCFRYSLLQRDSAVLKRKQSETADRNLLSFGFGNPYLWPSHSGNPIIYIIPASLGNIHKDVEDNKFGRPVSFTYLFLKNQPAINVPPPLMTHRFLCVAFVVTLEFFLKGQD